MNVLPHHFPSELLRSDTFKITANGQRLDVLRHHCADFAAFECAGAVDIEIEPGLEATLRPLSRGITGEIRNGRLCFTLPGPQNLQIEMAGKPLLYLYALPPAADAPAGKNVKRFAAGKVHLAGEIVLRDGEVCWLEPGAVVRGCIRASQAADVLIGGTGILQPTQRERVIIFDRCRDARVEDLLMLSPSGWMISIGGCTRVAVRGVRQLSGEGGTDGVDVVGSRDVQITGCCLHNGDDNIAIKALTAGRIRECPTADWSTPVENISVSQCMFWNCCGGTAMEIGYETSTARMAKIRFTDIDILGNHQFGSVFGIHNGDRALVEDVRWENIRVEHHYDKLVDFRTLNSRWNYDTERGHIRNVTLKHIRVNQSIFNSGYTVSVIAGYDAAHPVEQVCFDDFQINNRHITNADQLDLVTRNATGITFA